MIKVTKTGDWEVARFNLKTGMVATAPAIRNAVAQEAQWMRKVVVQGIRRQRPGGQPFARLSPMTIAVRRLQGFKGRKALIRNGDLIGGINVKRINQGWGAFVGILRQAKGKDGQKLVNVAMAQEFGAGPFIVEMTDKMRRFLFAAMAASKIKRAGRPGGGKGGGFVVIRIRARPFFGPVFKKIAKPPVVKKRVMLRVAMNMKGIMGKPTKRPPK